MTSGEIKATQHTDLSQTQWLKEIALQLAVLNESQPKVTTNPVALLQQSRRK